MNIILASHISDLFGPTEALIEYLQKKGQSFIAILNPLEYCEQKKRTVLSVSRGRIVKHIKPTNLKRPAVLSWMLDFILVLRFSLFTKGSIDIFIGCDPLNASAGVILKKIGKVKKLIFYSIDWSERRFKNSFINSVYYFLDGLSARYCDMSWCVTESLISLRKKQGIDRKKLILVPVGVTTKGVLNLLKVSYDKYALVFLGALEKTKGIELVIESWPEIKKKIPQARLIVIGKTPKGVVEKPYEESLKHLEGVELLGVLEHDEVLKKLPYYGVGLAPYSYEKDSVTRYADPSRIKDYLACGLPVITTKVPEIHQTISREKAGIVVDYNHHALEEGFGTVVNNSNYKIFRFNSVKLGKKYMWKTIYDNAFKKII